MWLDGMCTGAYPVNRTLMELKLTTCKYGIF